MSLKEDLMRKADKAAQEARETECHIYKEELARKLIKIYLKNKQEELSKEIAEEMTDLLEEEIDKWAIYEIILSILDDITNKYQATGRVKI